MKISRIMSIWKILTDLCLIRVKKHFSRYCLQCFSGEKPLIERKGFCLKKNGIQNVKLKRSSIRFKNFFIQLDAPFKIYADVKSILKGV